MPERCEHRDARQQSPGRNSLHPGTINTPMVRSKGSKMVAAGMVQEQSPAAAPGSVPLGDADDIANLSLFLASDESKFISGQEFIPDGGICTIMATLPA